MPDVDTSQNRDPSPTSDELLAIRDRMNARLERGEPVRIIRSANLRTPSWRSDAKKVHAGKEVTFPSSGNSATFFDRTAARCQMLAETGEHLGLERVGLIVETVEVQP